MDLFPGADNNSFTEQDHTIKSKVESFYSIALTMNQTFHGEANTDAHFNAGDQTLISEYYNIPLRTRKNYTINRIRPVTNVVVGYQRAKRKTIIVKPDSSSAQKGADQLTKVMASIFRNCNGYSTISEAFESTVITGMSVLELYIDYTDDPVSGDIKIDNCAYNSFFIDPYFRKKDLSDCNAILKRSFLSKETCKMLVPKKADYIETLTGGYSDEKFFYMPESTNRNEDLLAYDEYYYRAYRDRVLLIDKETQEQFEWTFDEDKLKQELENNTGVEVIRDKIPTVRLALLVNGHVVYDGPNPLSIDTYPFVPVFCHFDPNINDFNLRIQGIVRGMRDVQFLYNRRVILEQDALERRSTVSYVYKEDSLIDIDEPLMNQGVMMIRLKADADMSDFTVIPPVDIPESHFKLNEIYERNMMYIPGVNEEMLGAAEDDKAAILARLRQGQGLINLQTIFDQLDTSHAILGDCMIRMIQKNYTPQKIKSIINEDPIDEFYSKVFSKYRISVENGFDTTIQREEEFVRLMHLKDRGINIPDSAIINAASLQNKEDLLQAIQAQQSAAKEVEDRQFKINAEEQQATTNVLNARAESELAQVRVKETLSDKNRFDMIATAMDQSRKEYETNLDAVKVLKDLEQSDPNKIDELVELLAIIQQDRNEMNNEIKSNDFASPEDQIMQGMHEASPIASPEGPVDQGQVERMLQPNEQGF